MDLLQSTKLDLLQSVVKRIVKVNTNVLLMRWGEEEGLGLVFAEKKKKLCSFPIVHSPAALLMVLLLVLFFRSVTSHIKAFVDLRRDGEDLSAELDFSECEIGAIVLGDEVDGQTVVAEAT